jgi:hypothetical protein
MLAEEHRSEEQVEVDMSAAYRGLVVNDVRFGNETNV